jgi:hypothetical protein
MIRGGSYGQEAVFGPVLSLSPLSVTSFRASSGYTGPLHSSIFPKLVAEYLFHHEFVSGHFGVFHSRVHELWATKMGTRMGVGNAPRYMPKTCFGTFPFPKPTDEQRDAVAKTARHLDELRGNWLNPEGASEAELKKQTLTNLYNSRPTWLQNAHAALDRAIFVAYGWPENPDEVSEEESLGRLLALNARRA